jgi:hypothetical protein
MASSGSEDGPVARRDSGARLASLKPMTVFE